MSVKYLDPSRKLHLHSFSSEKWLTNNIVEKKACYIVGPYMELEVKENKNQITLRIYLSIIHPDVTMNVIRVGNLSDVSIHPERINNFHFRRKCLGKSFQVVSRPCLQ